MIFLSHIFIKHFSKLPKEYIQTYAIASGIVIYASLYMYCMAANTNLLQLFNKLLIYIVGIDLLLSTLIHVRENQIYEGDDNTDGRLLDESESDTEESELIVDETEGDSEQSEQIGDTEGELVGDSEQSERIGELEGDSEQSERIGEIKADSQTKVPTPTTV
uniref:Uncharacterized protein n=1 Tax=viral metagenome TaxID=1070528 RepID=A0A6C0E191_9ZZZZ